LVDHSGSNELIMNPVRRKRNFTDAERASKVGVRRRHSEKSRDQFPSYLINCSLHWHRSEATASTLRLTPTPSLCMAAS
jgi:hypothetical protein